MAKCKRFVGVIKSRARSKRWLTASCAAAHKCGTLICRIILVRPWADIISFLFDLLFTVNAAAGVDQRFEPFLGDILATPLATTP